MKNLFKLPTHSAEAKGVSDNPRLDGKPEALPRASTTDLRPQLDHARSLGQVEYVFQGFRVKKETGLSDESIGDAKEIKDGNQNVAARCIFESCVPTGGHIFPFDNVPLHSCSSNRDLWKHACFEKFESLFSSSFGICRIQWADQNDVRSERHTVHTALYQSLKKSFNRANRPLSLGASVIVHIISALRG